MTADDVWQSLVRKQPSLASDDATVEFRAGSLRRLLHQVWEQGERHGRQDGERAGRQAAEDRLRAAGGDGSEIFQRFNEIFGGGL